MRSFSRSLKLEGVCKMVFRKRETQTKHIRTCHTSDTAETSIIFKSQHCWCDATSRCYISQQWQESEHIIQNNPIF